MLPLNSNIFITGSTGFIGCYIVKKLLSEGFHNIYCLKREISDIKMLADVNDKIHWVLGDILDMPKITEQLEGMDVVIHAAAIVSFHTKNKKKLIETAMTGTANLVNAALDNDVKKFIHVSSIAAIGRRKKIEDINEKLMFSHSEFDTTYGLSKFLAEQEVWRGHAEGLNITILNPSLVLGAGDWEQSSIQIFKKVYQGLKFYPEGTNGWVDVRDVANSVHLAIKGNNDGKRFIISAENVSFEKMFQKMATHLNVKPPTKQISRWMAGLVWRLEAVRSYIFGTVPIVTKETIKSTSVVAHYDNTESINTLGLQYRPIDITVSESCKAFTDTWPHGIKWATFN